MPLLAQVKLAAEAGDAAAQFEYVQHVPTSKAEERMDWLLKSAHQGYAPAQDALAGYYYGNNPKITDRHASDREAVRWASRAAYQGFPSAQVQLARFYLQGRGVAQSNVRAYYWFQVTAAGDRTPIIPMWGNIAKAEMNQLIPKMSSPDIQDSHQQADAFKLLPAGQLNPVEAELVFSILKLSAIAQLGGKTSAVVNDVRFTTEETKEVKIDGSAGLLTCMSIEPKAARFAITGTKFEALLPLRD